MAMEGLRSSMNFDELMLAEKIQHLNYVGKRALKLWGYPNDTRMDLLNITENATYLLSHPDWDTHKVMRVHRIPYAEKDSIRSEIAWLLALNCDTGIDVPKPLRGSNGDYVQTVISPEFNEHRHVVCFEYEAGAAPIENHDLSIYHKLGEIAAQIHLHSKEWVLPEYYQRIAWDWDGTFGEEGNNFYGVSYKDSDVLDEGDLSILERCVRVIKNRLDRYGKSPDRFGLIHSDLRTANLLVDGDKIKVLDFDDCGMGWFMYDLASIFGFEEDRPDLDQVLAAVIEGYEQHIALSPEDKQEIRSFIMLRRIGLFESVIHHIGQTVAGPGENESLMNEEFFAYYAKETVRLAQIYMNQYSI
ncbi:serine/threonine protein kinase [compost metagenome]